MNEVAEESIDQADQLISASDQSLTSYRQKKKQVIYKLLIAAAVFGPLAVYTEGSAIFELIMTAVLIVLAMFWCNHDAAEYGHRISSGTRICLILLLILGFLIYALQTRGIKGIWLYLKAIGIAITMTVIYTLTATGTFYLIH